MSAFVKNLPEWWPDQGKARRDVADWLANEFNARQKEHQKYIDELICSGWGDVPQSEIPPNWREVKPPGKYMGLQGVKGATTAAKILRVLCEGPATAEEVAIETGIKLRLIAGHLSFLAHVRKITVVGLIEHPDRGRRVKLYGLPESCSANGLK